MENIYTVLRLLEDLEDSISMLYQRFSDDYAIDEATSFFFYKLSLDEIAHRDLVRYQLKLLRNARPDAYNDVDIDINIIRELIDNIEKKLNSDEKYPINRAVDIALEIESNAAEHHYKGAMKQAMPEMARLLDSLGKADKEHMQLIRNFIKNHELGI